MPDINSTILTPGVLPDDYQEVLSWKVADKRSRTILLNILAIPLLAVSGVVFFALAVSLGKLPAQNEFGLVQAGSVIAGILLTLILHEAVHGWVMQLFGARPKYGILWTGLMLYATSPGYAYHRNHYVVIALAPLVLISAWAILGMGLLQGTPWVALLSICGIINASGAIGDIWMSAFVLRYPASAYVMDERDGIRVFLPKPG